MISRPSRPNQIRRINLLPRRQASAGIQVTAGILPAMILGTLVLISIRATTQHYEFKRIRLEREELAARQKELTEKIEQLSQDRSSLEQRRRTAGTIQQIRARKILWADLFKELSLLVPSNAWLSTLNASSEEGRRKVRLSGSAQSPKAISSLFESFELSPFFKRVMLVSSEIDEKLHPEVYKYQFDIPIDAGKDPVATSPGGGP